MTGGTLRFASSAKVSGKLSNGAKYAGSDPNVVSLAYGTSSAQADIIVQRTRTLNAATAETLDLYSGGGTTLNDLFDDVAAFRKVKFLSISVDSGGDTSGVRIGAANTNEWVGFFDAAGDMIKIFPGGPPFAVGSPAGVAVGSTTKHLKIENLGAAAVTYTITVAGTSV